MIEELTGIVKFAGAVIALVGGPGTVWLGFRRVNQVLTGVTAIERRVGSIESNLGTNGGKSLRDAVDRIESRQILTAAAQLAMINTLEQAMFMADAAGEIQYPNHALERLTGYQRDELTGRGWLAALREDDRPRVAEGWLRAVRDRRLFHTTATFQHRDGYDIHTRIVAHPMRHERTDDVIGWFATIEIRGSSNLQPAKRENRSTDANYGF